MQFTSGCSCVLVPPPSPATLPGVCSKPVLTPHGELSKIAWKGSACRLLLFTFFFRLSRGMRGEGLSEKKWDPRTGLEGTWKIISFQPPSFCWTRWLRAPSSIMAKHHRGVFLMLQVMGNKTYPPNPQNPGGSVKMCIFQVVFSG